VYLLLIAAAFKKKVTSIRFSYLHLLFFNYSFIYLSGHSWKKTVICCSRTGQQSGLFSRTL